MAFVRIDTNGNILAQYGSPQPQDPTVTTIADTDPRIAAFQNPPSQQAAQQAAAAIAAGLAIVSTSTPALNATYPIDTTTLSDIVAVAASLAENQGFPEGLTTVQFPDVTGVLHSFSTTTFPPWASAIRDRVTAIKQAARAIAAGQSATFPSSTVTIP